ncbi:TetR/AcrR family transcriptional regulator [Nocardia speluncae]|uniref:TetR/AcrR family transcriptional regulator n=1 Tax=Nocardia speluncae TaxID=419477 RepID=A0A846XEY8_9NOCA|nr:TetR/AcrR family transcriptional regulator [Nocardia speluncae]NKY34522.1 TetR/AcrR family transcriptional regulator [Nocardia speluncae]
MPQNVSAATRERLLTAAERLLLTDRYEEVSVRRICAEAGANAAAVHYHFGSKEALLAALLEDRLGALWADRLAEATAAPRPVAEIVDAVLAPFTDLAADPLGRLHLRLLAQCVIGRQVLHWQQQWFRIDSWSGLLPHVDERESRYRWMLAFDLIIMRFGAAAAEDRPLSPHTAATLRDFVVAGLTASTGDSRRGEPAGLSTSPANRTYQPQKESR